MKNDKAKEKADKCAAAKRRGFDCGYHGFSSASEEGFLSKASKAEKDAFDQGMYEGCMQRSKENASAKR